MIPGWYIVELPEDCPKIDPQQPVEVAFYTGQHWCLVALDDLDGEISRRIKVLKEVVL